MLTGAFDGWPGAYGAGLADKPAIVALNKSDAMTTDEVASCRAVLADEAGRAVPAISGATGSGVEAVLAALLTQVDGTRADDAAPAAPVLTLP